LCWRSTCARGPTFKGTVLRCNCETLVSVAVILNLFPSQRRGLIILTKIELRTTMSWKTGFTRRPCKNGIKVLQNALKLAPRTDITIDTSNAATQPRTIIGCLQTLIRCLMFPINYLGLPLRQSNEERQVKSAADVVLVAIDMKNLQSLVGKYSKTANSQVGLAMLDTRSISKLGS
jgi:hypothetical protein